MSSLFRSASVAIVALSFVCLGFGSQENPVFKSTSRIVVVDVVVLDDEGHHVTGLTQQDFIVEDNGSPQHVQQFEAVTPPGHLREVPQVKLPPHQYTNFPVQEQGRAVNIVLLDMLNTTPEQQIYARVQMVRFLRTLPPGQRTALFILGRRLQMLQGFSGSSEDLARAGEKLLTEKNLYTTSLADAQKERDHNAYVVAAIGRGGAVTEQNLLESLRTAISYGADVRAGYTLAALQSIARTVSGYAGRKNLLWLSSNFPFRLGPDVETEKMTDYRRAIAQTANILASSHMAVYPIDVEGLPSSGIDISGITSTYTWNEFADQERAISNRQSSLRWETHSSMSEIAEQTGGQAFWGSNDLQHALARGMERGSSYYTLAYSPSNVKWDGQYRKIEVKTNRSKVKLFYRHGYYATRDDEAKGDVAAKMLAAALQPTAPESTMLLMRVQVLPPDVSNKNVRIDYAVAPGDVTFLDLPDGKKRLVLDFMAAVFDDRGRDVTQVSNTLQGNLPRESYQAMLKTGIPAHQEIELKPGTYSLRLGVIDRLNHKIGTLDVPLTVENH